MKANERTLLTACIDTGIYAGWTRAHKHTDKPHELQIAEEIENAIWHEIDQYFVFDSERDLCDEVVKGFDQLEKEREWVGLTKKEIESISERVKPDPLMTEEPTWHIRFAQAVQRKLKEKNNE